MRRISFSLEFKLSGVFSLTRPGRFNKFSFSRSSISLDFKTRMSFLLESAKVCQLYFCFCLQNRFGVAECIGGLPEIVHRSVAASAARIHGFCNPSRAHAEETFAPGDGIRLASAWQARRHSAESCSESATTVMFASWMRASPDAVDCDEEFPQKHAAGISRSRLRL